jgi:guanylate kinase
MNYGISNVGKLFVISGPSGTGKGTICDLVAAKGGVEVSISATTRNPREGEKDGLSYFFLSRDDFESKIEKGEFLEYAKVYDNYYGTPKRNVEGKLESGKDIILEIDIQGALQVKKTYPEAVLIYILPPSFEELKKRLIGRGTETEEIVKMRLSRMHGEIAMIGEYNYFVVNRDLDEAVERVRAIMTAEHLRVDKLEKELIERYSKCGE